MAETVFVRSGIPTGHSALGQAPWFDARYHKRLLSAEDAREQAYVAQRAVERAEREVHAAEVKAAQRDLAHARIRLRDLATMAQEDTDPHLELKALELLHKLNAPLLVPPKNRDVYMGDLE